MNNEIKVMNNDEIRDFCIKKDLKIFELEQELQQKENIIKKVREYITSYINQFNGVYPPVDMRYLDLHKILHILKGEDKE